MWAGAHIVASNPRFGRKRTAQTLPFQCTFAGAFRALVHRVADGFRGTDNLLPFRSQSPISIRAATSCGNIHPYDIRASLGAIQNDSK
jgi:hypothetical protein